MSDDYLWDKSGTPDPDLATLEGKLSRLRWQPRELRVPERPERSGASWRARIALAASIALIGGAALVLAPAGRGPTVEVAALAGTARAGAARLRAGEEVSLARGQEVVTEPAARARITLANGIGWVDVEPSTRIRLEEVREDRQQLELREGTIAAQVTAVPRLFVVDTPAARAIDLGCAYTLTADAAGDGRLHVTSGQVELERGPRRVIVPAGAACEIRKGVGPGIPYFTDATPTFREAVHRLNGGDWGAIPVLLNETRNRDAYTLVFLLPRLPTSEVPAVYAKLAAIVPPPPGVTQAAIAGRVPWALDAWRKEVMVGAQQPWKILPRELAPGP